MSAETSKGSQTFSLPNTQNVILLRFFLIIFSRLHTQVRGLDSKTSSIYLTYIYLKGFHFPMNAVLRRPQSLVGLR